MFAAVVKDIGSPGDGKMALIFSAISIMAVVTCALGVWLKCKRNSNLDRKRV